MDVQVKTCSMCREQKLISAFPRRNSRCISCNRVYSKANHAANKTERLINMRVTGASSKAKRYGVEDTLTVEEWRIKLQQANYKCERCGGDWAEIHHLWPMFWGGANSYDNIAVRCTACHKADHQELWKIRKFQIRATRTEKACSTCGVTKPLDQFHRDSDALDGRAARCKECRKVEWINYALSKKVAA